MKTKRAMVFASVLLCTFLSLNPTLHQVAQFPVLQESSQSDFPQLTGILSSLIVTEEVKAAETDAIMAANTGKSEIVQVTYKLFGLIPFKSSAIQVMPQLKLLPGGQSIGVSLQAKGVMVVGQAAVQNQEGKLVYPAKEAGIEVGDIILKIDGREMNSDQDVANAIHRAGEKQGFSEILLNHNGQTMQKRVSTVYCPETNRHRVGLYVRNEAAGVGTLTFYDPTNHKYGALGHVINDVDTNQKIEILNGNVVASTIYAIEKGKRGHPGEKIGSFVNQSRFSGNIEKNTVSGIFGSLEGEIKNPYFQEPITVGWESEIKEGPAKIYTVLEGERIEEYDVQIERIMHNRTDSKNMVIKVTDPELIEKTGGIIQGMSGSPIVQDGKIIGAVTHVFVNDASRGYGVFIQNMLKDAEIIDKKEVA
ncbi:SpoIVB peptidase [Desulfitobacterium chlororespirans]|uniref:SpoIVB peptidase. Serine peptidase. MEROPS family S55 n=1 Tax=Desulfitobacterium chlororespirans DSM 11544 TaxID=1121395 RepID=A0A1M7U5Q6_9FIRM|nr:SpoIVB peptidase [Desulfitobacterium chlororespirans]SHN78391.1 SpoIVB peptidase. Serine peptidase. MEROPS family S55 [Desulfitobacterium chlororespirans DSM 11544]